MDSKTNGGTMVDDDIPMNENDSDTHLGSSGRPDHGIDEMVSTVDASAEMEPTVGASAEMVSTVEVSAAMVSTVEASAEMVSPVGASAEMVSYRVAMAKACEDRFVKTDENNAHTMTQDRYGSSVEQECVAPAAEDKLASHAPQKECDAHLVQEGTSTLEVSEEGSGPANSGDYTSADMIVEEVNWTPPSFSGTPHLLTSLTTPFAVGNFTKGCKWSPDGTCLLVCSEDARLRVMNLPVQLYGATEPPELATPPAVALQSHEGELIYDYAWFPLMRSDTPATCCYASTSRGHPIHLFDAFDGGLRCSYRAYNNVDEVTAAYSLAFDPSGDLLYAGLDGALSVFDVSQPGRQTETRKLKDKSSASQPGIVSCIGFCAACPDMYAVGTYLRTVGLYSSADGSPLCLLHGQTCGVTHLQFSPDGNRLYTGGRKDPEILCWDLRNLGHILYSLQREVTTNQRVYFDSDVTGRYVFSGDADGCVQVWDTQALPADNSESLILPSLRRFSNNRTGCVNGVSAHPWLPVLATSSGERHLSSDASASSGEDSDRDVSPTPECAVKLWWLGS